MPLARAASRHASANPDLVRLAVEGMGTRFELIVHHPDSRHARAAGEEALAEIERLDRHLSAFRSSSIIGRLNARAGGPAIPIDSETLALLELAAHISLASGGTFDPTIGPLMHAWGFRDSPPPARPPNLADVAWGMNSVELNAYDGLARLCRLAMSLDLGAIAKGWALDAAAHILRDSGITRAFLHGGTSSAVALGAPAGLPGWTVRIPSPAGALDVSLADAALSYSAPHGRTVTIAGRTYGHVLDPRTGAPAADPAEAALCVHASASVADAWSTSLLLLPASHPYPPDLAWAVCRHAHWTRGGPHATILSTSPVSPSCTTSTVASS